MKISSYQKLKNQIEELEKEKSLLVNDIYHLIKEPEKLEGLMCKVKWKFKFDIDEMIWRGDTEMKELKGLI